jgi:hypothetical protein
MYSNELLDEKDKAQKELFIQAEKEGKEYFKLIEEEVQELFRRNDWDLKYSKRKGGYLEWLGTGQR